MTQTGSIVRSPAKGHARHKSRVFCLPHAGGSAATFTPWRDALDPGIELCAVQCPGRGPTAQETPINDPAVMVSRLCDEIEPLLDLPYVLFGHSLGALMAFEITRELRARGLAMPRRLMLSACRAPIRLPSPFIVNTVNLSEAEFARALTALGGIPEEVTSEPAFREIVVSATRRDFDLVARYRYRTQERLAVPALLLYGRDDRHVGPDMLDDWQLEFKELTCRTGFSGGHFYFEHPAARDAILGQIERSLAPLTTVSII